MTLQRRCASAVRGAHWAVPGPFCAWCTSLRPRAVASLVLTLRRRRRSNRVCEQSSYFCATKRARPRLQLGPEALHLTCSGALAFVRRLSADPEFKRKTLLQLNAEAVQFHRDGDDLRCVAAYAKFFRKLRENNVVHKELYVAHSNRAAAYLNLGLYEEALWDARRCAELAELQFARTQDRLALPSYIKSFERRGFALMGMGLHRLAKTAFEEGLQYDPFAEELKRGLEESTQALLGDLLAGHGRETLALPAPTKRERIAYLPYATPLHQVHPASLLPVSLLTPFQADNDHHVKDTYNYMTVRAALRFP